MVAKCAGLKRDDPEVEIYIFLKNHDNEFLHYSTDWAQGGPFIEREKIAVLPCPRGWSARIGYGGKYIEGPAPLVAAMRCYIFSKLGDEVEIPEELQC